MDYRAVREPPLQVHRGIRPRALGFGPTDDVYSPGGRTGLEGALGCGLVRWLA